MKNEDLDAESSLFFYKRDNPHMLHYLGWNTLKVKQNTNPTENALILHFRLTIAHAELC